jgi:hypothetical protein
VKGLGDEARQRIENVFVAEFEHSGSAMDALDDVFPVVAALVAAAEERGAAKERERWAGWPQTDNRVTELMTYEDLPPDIKAIVERARQDGGLRYAAREQVKYMLPRDKALAWSIVDGIALVAERMLRGAS